MSKTQSKVLAFIRNWQNEKRYSPSQNDLSVALGYSRSYIQKIINSLVESGYLEVSPIGTICFFRPLSLPVLGTC